jgi:CxxC motif-containing protein (DUF1111 family)
VNKAGALLACSVLFGACGSDASQGLSAEANEAFSGGEATVFDATRMAYAQALPALTGEREDEFFVGNGIFNRGWVTAPASVKQFDGLGPLFNATNCSACHFKDGRGRPPEAPDEALLSMLVRLSVPGEDAHGGPKGEPNYGGQLQGNAILGVPAEGFVRIQYEDVKGEFDDGERYTLRKPSVSIEALAYGQLAKDVMFSPRVAPAVFGLGLLAAIPEETLEALADAKDRDGDGISGRINHVWDVRKSALAVGRFGWKANQPTLEQQSAGAFQGDMGITSGLFQAQECSAAELACSEAPTGGAGEDPELTPALLESVVYYMHTLAVPARRDVDDAEVLRGKQVFGDSGCASCHVSELETGDLPGFPELEPQVIRPYTDLLLHDMGEELADGRPDFEASGSEWRTAPLWGVGLVKTVNRHEYFLHDGRARGLMEAVLWHGGEAREARKAVLGLPREDREALLAFLKSL